MIWALMSSLNYPAEGIHEFRWRLKHIRVNTANLHEIFQDIHVTVGIGREAKSCGRSDSRCRMRKAPY